LEQNIQHRATQINDALSKDAATATGGLVEFAMQYAGNNHQIHRALVLKLNYSNATDPRERQQLVKEMQSLVEAISDDPVEDLRPASQRSSGRPMPIALEEDAPNAVSDDPDIVCEAVGLQKKFKRSSFSLTDVSAQFRLGEITGVVGENGNGKTTMFRILVGELAADSGTLSYPGLLGVNATSFDWGTVKQQIAFISQDLPRWFGSVRDNLHYELAVHGIKGKENDEEVDYIIYRLGLEEHQNKSWSQLSGGYKLRFALARALVWKPKFLVIDEPLANLDIKAQLVILNDLRDLANSYRYPLSIVISSQHLHEIENVSDRIIFLRDGAVVYIGKTSDLGKERDENTFEFKTKLTLEAIEQRLGKIEYYNLENTGQEYMLTTPLHVKQNDILKAFIEADIEVDYFRNISQSTKKLFV